MTESDGVSIRTVRIAMNGVTGRMGRNQHLIRSILAIQSEGGLRVGENMIILPEPILLGRNEAKLASLAAEVGVDEWSTDLATVLQDDSCEIYFDAQLTAVRQRALEAAIRAGKHVYAEKPLALDVNSAVKLARLAIKNGVKHGVVQDKLFLPGMLKLRRLVESGFFGEIFSVRGDFGYWVFPGPDPVPQRPSWNYRREDGGGIVSDMFAHWQYVLEELFTRPQAVFVLGATHLSSRTDEYGSGYMPDAEDAAYATFELGDGVVAQLNSSWCVRVHRDELFELQVDGSKGSAVAGLVHCVAQPAELTPRSVWNPDLPDPISHRAGWCAVPDATSYENAFRSQWEHYLRHVVLDEPFSWDFASAARGIQLAELGMQSWQERRLLDIPELAL